MPGHFASGLWPCSCWPRRSRSRPIRAASIFPPRESLSSLPSQIDGWTGTDSALDQETLDILGPGEFLVRDYENASQPQLPDQSLHCVLSDAKGGRYDPFAEPLPAGRRMGSDFAGGGSDYASRRIFVPCQSLRGFKCGGNTELVLYWFQAHGREVASEYWAKYYLVSDSVRMNRSDGALVRLMTPMLDGESPDAAQARMMKLGSQFLPLLDNYIPAAARSLGVNANLRRFPDSASPRTPRAENAPGP